MKVLVVDSWIVGEYDGLSGIPDGYQALEAPEVSIDTLMVHKGKVKPRPPKPDGECRWDGSRWCEVVNSPLVE